MDVSECQRPALCDGVPGRQHIEEALLQAAPADQAGSAAGMKLDSLVTVVENRTSTKQQAILDEDSHPLRTVIRGACSVTGCCS